MKYRNASVVLGAAVAVIAIGVATALGGPVLRAINGPESTQKVSTLREVRASTSTDGTLEDSARATGEPVPGERREADAPTGTPGSVSETGRGEADETTTGDASGGMAAVPGVKLPSVPLPGLTTPAVSTPGIAVTVPPVSTPSVSVPGVPVTVPSVTVTAPPVTVPSVTLPPITLPTVTIPPVTVPLPLPDLGL